MKVYGTLPFTETFEVGLGAWTTNGTWGLTTQQAVSPTHSAADSPGAFYANNTDSFIAMASGVDLSASVRPALGFYLRHVLEAGYDYLRAEVSTNGGVAWQGLPAGLFTGTQNEWTPVQLPMDSAIGAADVRIRFRMTTDGSVVQDGVYIDDVIVGERPAPVVLVATSESPTRVALGWTPAVEGDLAAYQLVRSLSSNFDVRAATVVATLFDLAATSHIDIAVSPKTRYYYRVLVVRSNRLYEISNEVSAQTDEGMEAPFLDNGEGGGAMWIPDPPWALDADAAQSGALGWSDSPGTNYADGVNASLTLAAPVVISGWSRPTLMFNHRSAFLSGDFGYVEVSTNAGSSWVALATFTSVSSTWSRMRYDLSLFGGSPTLLIRFRITSDASGRADGWGLDDISISDAPAMIPAPDVIDLQPTAISLSWPASDHPSLAHYVVIRSMSNNPTINTQPQFVTATNTYTDTGLMVDSNYHYRVFAVDTWGGFSPASPTSTAVRTIIPVLPFADDFESGGDVWRFDPMWMLTTGTPYRGSVSLGNGLLNYSNSVNSTANLRVNLAGTVRPVLRFFDQHRLAINDYGYIEISSPGRSTRRMYGVAGVRTNWQEQVIDLSYYKGYANVQITFQLTTDGIGTDEGWKIDDVSVTDEGTQPLAVPVVDDCDDLDHWVETSHWVSVSGTAQETIAWITPETHYYLTINGDLDLSTVNNPQLTAWVKGNLGFYSRFALQVSANGGSDWSELWVRSTESGNFSNEWQRIQVSLSPYKSSSFRMRWQLNSYYGTLADANVFIDKVTIADAPVGVGVLPPEPALKSATINWTASELGDAFQAYRVWRSPDTNPNNGNDVVVGVVSNEATPSFVDTGLSIGSTYYYWVYVCDTNDIWTLSTNYVAVTTVPVVLPFADNYDDLSQWDVTGDWGIDLETGSLTDSPVGDYGNGLNITAKTAVNLSGTTRPVLRFSDWHRLAVNDYGYIEVSSPGRTTYRMYGVAGARTNWTDQVIDLSYYKGYANVQILFRLTTDANGTDEGWKIDDISVTDEGTPSLAVPLVDDYDNLDDWVETSHWAAVSGNAQDTIALITPETHYYLTISGDLDLTTVNNPQLTAWVKGNLGYYSRFALQVSANGGGDWSELWVRSTESGNFSNEWQRIQVSLTPYKSGTFRMRWQLNSYYGTLAEANVFIDKVTIADAPVGVGLLPPVPALKSAQINWTASALGDAFQSYRVLRSPDTSPFNGNDVVAGVVSNEATSSFVDSGLSIGATYYYWVYLSDTNDIWTISTNYVSVTTVPVVLPFTDAFDDASQWDVSGDWGIDSGAECLTDSPAGDYGNGLNITAKTAVNLSGTTRPVLRFSDWHRLAVNDYGYIEVSSPGRTTYRMYGVAGARTNWTDQVIDLSYYKGYANVQILFRLTTDANGTDEGWKIDDISVTDEGTPSLAVPLVDDYDNLDDWVETSHWAAVSGNAQDTIALITPETHYYLTISGDLDLTTVNNPQLTAWVKGNLGYYSRFALQVSANGGGDWSELWVRSTESGNFSNEWQRIQVSLTPYKSGTFRMRWQLNSYYGTLADANVFIDKVTIADAPVGVGVLPPEPALKSATINWTASELGESFQAYRVWRSPDANPNNGNDMAVGSVSNEATPSFVDTGLSIGATYYYWVYVCDTNDIWTISTNYVAVTTVPVVLPFADAFDDLNQWDVTGDWGVDTNEGVLFDSPVGNYANGQDTYAQTAVNLVGTVWPVLRFSDAYRLAVNDYGFVEVSINRSSYTRVYGISGAQTNGQAQEIDLSQWKNQPNVRVRFRLVTDGTGTDDGWLIDDMTISDRGAHTLPVPFYDGFESGRSNWLESIWMVSTNQPYAGSNLVVSGITHMQPEVQGRLPLAGSMDLSLTTNPRVTFRVRGSLGPYAWLQFQVSPDGGLTWSGLWSVNYEMGWNTNQWSQQLFSLAAYRTTDVRFRFLLYSYYSTYAPVNISIDHFSVGEAVPGAPFLHRPANFANTESIRPTLVVYNAFDPDFDPLTYRFEVYGDEGLSNLLAQVPAVASGVDQTAWQVDVNLANSQPYWWRCRASDASNAGPWMATAMFFINETNTPPETVVVAGPPKGATLRNPGGILSWYPSSDIDAGDTIRAYHIQVDPDAAFTAPLVDDENVLVAESPTGSYWTVSRSLGELVGWDNLGMISNYYWRIRAQDTRYKWSAWSAPGQWFIYGVPPPDPAEIRINTNGTITFVWNVGTENFYVYHSPSLVTQHWQVIAGPLDQNQITLSPPGNETEGFYRVSGE